MCKLYNHDTWNPWTQISAHIPFKSNKRCIGDGEAKLAAEFDIKPMGQNTSFDLHLPFGEKWECKKCDSDKSFRLGVDISSPYTRILHNVISLMDGIIDVYDQMIGDTITKSEIGDCLKKIAKTSMIDKFEKHEVSASSLKNADEIIAKIKLLTNVDNKLIHLYSSKDASLREYSLLAAFEKLTIEELPSQDISNIVAGTENFNKLLIIRAIGTVIEKFKRYSLTDMLNNIVRSTFTSKRLVLVHEQYGFMLVENLNFLVCNRITSGKPRCAMKSMIE